MSTATTTTAPVASPLRRILRALVLPFAMIAEAQARAGEYERLSRMSDAGLAKMGLKRGDLPAYVCRDLK